MAKVMIVEDNLNIALGLEEIVKSIRSDIDTTITAYAKDALKEATLHEVDLFLLDIQLFDYSGLELANQLRKIDRYKMTPIVFITAIPTKELLAFKQIHCYDYIVKPFRKEEVIEIVSTILNFGIKKEEYINFNLKNYIYRVKLDEIIYIEVIMRKIKVVTIKEEIELSKYTLQGILDELRDNFIRCHRGYVVNIDYISKIDRVNNYILLDKGHDKIPIGRKYRDNLGGVVGESN